MAGIKKYIIFSGSYDENIGGVIALHKLCSLLNELGYEAYIYPFFKTYELNKYNWFITSAKLFKAIFKEKLKKFKLNPEFNTPIYKKSIRKMSSDTVVIYPDIVLGNPLNAAHVVRWFLYNPGRHSKKIFYGNGELYFDYNDFSRLFNYPASKVSKEKLTITHFPFEYYNLDGALESYERSGTAYCLRKGKSKKIVHDLKDSILIDGKSHQEISSIFKRVSVFISYDTHTAYSSFAVICGADSVVIPDENITKEEMYPNIEDRYGIAYGFNDIDLARETKGKLLEYLKKREDESKSKVRIFVSEVSKYFDSSDDEVIN